MKKLSDNFRIGFVVFFIFVLIFLEKSFNKSESALINPITPTPVITIVPTPLLYEDRLWSLVQNWRASQNLQTYIKDQKLCDIALKRVIEIQNDWSHNDFYKYSQSLSNDLNKEVYLAENLSKGFVLEEQALNNWLTSPDHKKNLDTDYKYSCIKCRNYYCSHEFANY